MSVLPSIAGRPRGSNFELWSWVFMRVSALLLIFLTLAHFAIMHLFTPTESVNYAFVVERFSTPFWRTYDLVMLFLGVLHGMNGLRIIADDYVHSRGWRAFWMIVIYTVAFVFLVIGSQVVLSFQPVTVP
jgi:succinate dehydrogenase / fumarate reductase membrane anchor subunit